MPTAITLASPAAFTAPLFKPLPVIAGNLAWSYMGGSLAQSQNVASGGAYTNGGSGPAWQSNYGRCSNQTAWVQTPILTTAPGMTMLIATRYVSGAAGASATPFGPGAAAQTGMFFNFTPLTGTGGATASCGGVTGSTTLTISTNITAFRFYAVTSGGGVAQMIYNETDGTQSAAGTVGNNTVGNGTLAFGTGTSGSNDRVVDVAFGAIYNSVLSKAQIDTIYAHVKDVLASRGVVV